MHPDAAPLRIAIAGFGALGQRIALGIDSRPHLGWQLTAIGTRDPARARAAAPTLARAPRWVAMDEIADHADLVVECTSAQAVPSIARHVLDRGRALMIVSVAGLLLERELEELAQAAGHRVLIPSGAIGGLDAVRALRWQGIEQARLTTRKPPAAFAGIERPPHLAPATAWQVFAGSAREAALRFPQNLNVAAAFAIAGAGFDRTLVEVWADPSVDANVHRIDVHAAAGRFSAEMRAHASANPASSGVAADSALALLAMQCRGHVPPVPIPHV